MEDEYDFVHRLAVMAAANHTISHSSPSLLEASAIL